MPGERSAATMYVCELAKDDRRGGQPVVVAAKQAGDDVRLRCERDRYVDAVPGADVVRNCGPGVRVGVRLPLVRPSPEPLHPSCRRRSPNAAMLMLMQIVRCASAPRGVPALET
jgi:hypothetical protein